MATVQLVRESEVAETLETSPRSPEAKLGMKVEDLWDVQEPQLSATEKLNACFESIPVSAFPSGTSSQVVEIKSDTSLAEAVKILADNKILSAPVLDVDAPEDATWMDRYIGVVEFSGIAIWILHQARLGTLGPEDASATSGNFFEALTSSEFYKNMKVRDISGSFRWVPFLALQQSNSFLTMLLLLSKYKMKSVPVIALGDGKIDSIITQSAVIHMLAECAGLQWFESWGTKKLSEIGLPSMSHNHIIKVYEEEPVLQAFKLMRKKRIGAVPVVESDGRKAVGNISLRDVHFLLTAPEIYRDYRSITAKNFLTAVRSYLKEHHETSPMLSGMITCTKDHTIKELILKLDSEKIHRIYVVDDAGNLEGVITLRDVISRLVHEPPGYFGDFFDGVLPWPQNSRV
ncbi:SNF1-related protein kinase regulatory subunit gamma-1 isoform X2 [Hevea brasiliensis]|uniref:SNF1-related protein kinase regulatory subunit gamma-1 isoform X2 n=1 Tax=Hevea brasiliensis TaxID=3981 RepID=UPI0025F59746|nr:SNF1-related protein kinase regulatory subunit gamma-1 isoform X2 [Hevea brasiliensis]